MGRSRGKAKSNAAIGGGFGALPRVVWEHPDYCQLSGSAAKLLMDLACQYNGHNNGNLTVAYSVLKRRGWNSKETISKAIQHLLDAGLVIRTREGRFINPGGQCALYALAWHAINECPGKVLIVRPTTTPPRKFTLEASKTPGPQTGQGSVHNPGRQRERNERGEYVSDQKPGRLWAVT